MRRRSWAVLHMSTNKVPDTHPFNRDWDAYGLWARENASSFGNTLSMTSISCG